MTKLEGILIGVVLILLGLGAFDLYARHEGAQACARADTAAATTAQVKDAHIEANAIVAQAAEDTAREKALNAPIAPAPVVSVQSPAIPSGRCPVPKAPSPPAASDGGAAVREPDAPGVVQGDWNAAISSSVLIAHQCDIELKDRDELLKERQ